MNPVQTIIKKRNGEELSDEEIKDFVAGVTTGKVMDYQASAFLMAVYFKGMTLQETVSLTEAMYHSGETYDLSNIPGPKVDKHSTGGVGDKVSLILAPLAASCGLKVPMMSGRALGHSGGTLDKLESIQGFKVQLSRPRFNEILEKTGCVMIGQSEKIAPADRKLYAIRDVTGTVECIPLIVASILSKKLAEGARGLVLDVKVGSGAFMKNKAQAKKLAKTLIQVAKKLKLPCRAIISDMNQPLGYAVGNALEVRESIEILQNRKSTGVSSDLRELTIQLCAHMLVVGKVSKRLTDARKLASKKLSDGSAWTSFQELVREQGGAMNQILNPDSLPSTSRQIEWKAWKKGYITKMDAEWLGRALTTLRGGRVRAEDRIDPSVGFVFHKKLGNQVAQGDSILTVHVPEDLDEAVIQSLEADFKKNIKITNARRDTPQLIYETLT